MNRTALPQPSPQPLRCAVYTRKSTEEGLEQEFNSLDAQREAGEACVASLRHEGWQLLPDRYDDGGYSGGNMDRPALKRLLADIEARKIDVVVVYKVDRLSRSLLDFTQILQVFERQNVSFVSVTQQFNTATSMGRLVLNMLLAFAQFERELISERTRDKMGAARRKGKWISGTPPLGYDVRERKLVVNEVEAELVREVFALYLRERSTQAVTEILDGRGLRQKSCVTKKGGRRGGGAWDRGAVHRLLTNVHYVGQVRYEGQIYDGEQPPLIDRATFDRVQAALADGRNDRGAARRNEHGFLLRGLVHCRACGSVMTSYYAVGRGGRSHRYYKCTAVLRRGVHACPVRSVAAGRIEAAVVQRIRDLAQNPALITPALERAAAAAERERASLARDENALRSERSRHHAEAQRLTALATDSTSDRFTGGRLRELDQAIAEFDQRLAEIAAARAEIDRVVVGREDVRAALTGFDQVWEHLRTVEKARIVRLLFAQVGFDGRSGQIEIVFHAEGVAALVREGAKTPEVQS